MDRDPANRPVERGGAGRRAGGGPAPGHERPTRPRTASDHRLSACRRCRPTPEDAPAARAGAQPRRRAGRDGPGRRSPDSPRSWSRSPRGGGDEPAGDSAPLAGSEQPGDEQAAGGNESGSEEAADPAARRGAPPEEATASDEQAAAPASGDPAALNDQGFALIQEGRYEEAIPVLQQAVDAYPEGSEDLNYAYALFNLGNALREAGRPDEAIPILEQRLEIPNQTETVQAELDLARKEAEGG